MFTVTVNENVIGHAFSDLEKQLRFAAAQALTRTVQDAQEEVKRQLPERFTIRTGWLAKGIRIRPASRNNLKASVLVKDAFMALQETGGDKTSPFGDALGVPVGARPTPAVVTRPSKFPGALLAKKGFFIAPIVHGSRTMGVWKRTGKGRGERLTLMYVFERKVRLEPKFGFHETVRKVALESFPHRFAEALRQALASRR
ncbi:MAG: hypothetical protein HQL82_13605 [Magnetococcales bacterium]|nr:hypothetical protein [Magnetococcales bacterium]